MSKPVILCVDDEKIVLDSLKEQLRSRLEGGYIIETAESGAEALEIVEEIFEDEMELGVIISDQIMPEMKGDELLKTIHGISPKTLKILLTGQADAQAVGMAVNYANLYRYIAKPWQADDLVLTVKEAMKSYLQDRKLDEQNKILQMINQELKQLNHAYERFVPREILQFLNKQSIIDVQLGDQIQQEMTLLFSDIRSFTSLSETMPPQENFNFINDYLGRVSPIIRKYKGFIDKYMGDAVMALFPNSVQDATQAAIDMQKAVVHYNLERQQRDHSPIRIGIGLHTGMVMLGTIGETERMEGTVISDAVNLASRLEGLTKVYGASIIISDQILSQLGSDHPYQIRYLDRVQVKGKVKSVSIYEIIDGDPEEKVALKLKTLPHFEEGITHYQNEQFSEAKKCFDKVLTIHEQDKATQLYLDRVLRFMKDGTPENWDGVLTFFQK